ncbi:MAG: 30S ribosomal protein S8 [bacterium]|nr:MAG: 30S ribosomal protein S8 [candidate division TA06 bacterium 32_111]MDI6700075.1 30S ribosomal protein S8 [bacterium]HCP15964.1 30S ribosomal protein S8 [candidate division WOR-3 bacterium]
MTITDPIADMLTIIRNAQRANLERIVVNSSKIKKAILEILKREGYIKDFKEFEKSDGKRKFLEIVLKYDRNGLPVIHSIEKISKPGIRIYRSYKELKPVMGGMGISIISTNKGLITDKEARRNKVGGEVVCRIW